MLDINKLHYYHKLTPQGYVEDTSQVYDFGTVYLINEAESMGITCEVLEGTSVVQLKLNNNIQYMRNRLPGDASHLAFIAAQNKEETKKWLAKAKVTVCKGFPFSRRDSEQLLSEIFNTLQKPLLVKPIDASMGDGITTNINDLVALQEAVKLAFSFTRSVEASVLIEETFVGNECRIFVSKKHGVLAAMKRVPANVIGDGVHTVQQLIDQKNKDPRRLNLPGALFRQIEIDENSLHTLAQQDLTLESVLAIGKQVFLRTISNLSQGGDGVDITDEIHPSIKEIAHRTVMAIPGLEFSGLDFMSKDFSAQQTDDSYAVIEVNSSAELAIHDDPIVGKNRHVCQAFLLHLFPELEEKFPLQIQKITHEHSI